MKKVLILVNGEYGNYNFCKDIAVYDAVICADNGMHHARQLNIKPDLIVGDFDSSWPEDLAYFKALGVQIESFNSHKDATDTELAVERAITMGAETITIWGGTGTRIDHSLANIQLLYKLLQLGIKGTLVSPYNTVCLITKSYVILGERGQTLSLIPFGGEARGVTTTDLEYPLQDATLSLDNSLGISNVMLQTSAKITVEEGFVLVIKVNEE